jgi:hypothetical protein
VVLRGYIQESLRPFSETLCLSIWGQPASVFGQRDSGFASVYSRNFASFFEDIMLGDSPRLCSENETAVLRGYIQESLRPFSKTSGKSFA